MHRARSREGGGAWSDGRTRVPGGVAIRSAIRGGTGSAASEGDATVGAGQPAENPASTRSPRCSVSGASGPRERLEPAALWFAEVARGGLEPAVGFEPTSFALRTASGSP